MNGPANQSVRGLIQWARGMCTDEEPHTVIDEVLSRALDAQPTNWEERQVNGWLEGLRQENVDLREELGRYRAALSRIADAKSGVWGEIAHEALTAKHWQGPDQPEGEK